MWKLNRSAEISNQVKPSRKIAREILTNVAMGNREIKLRFRYKATATKFYIPLVSVYPAALPAARITSAFFPDTSVNYPTVDRGAECIARSGKLEIKISPFTRAQSAWIASARRASLTVARHERSRENNAILAARSSPPYNRRPVILACTSVPLPACRYLLRENEFGRS